MTCNCKSDLEARLLDRAKEQLPDSKKRGVVLEKGGLMMSFAVCEISSDSNPEQYSFDLAKMSAPHDYFKKNRETLHFISSRIG